MPSPPPLQAFTSAVLVNAQGEPWQPSVLPTFVISACCPFSEPMDDAANLALHSSLQKRLKKLLGRPQAQCTMEEVVGQSADGRWKEPSWAVTGIDEGEAIALGRLFYQWAIFRFDENGRTLLYCWEGNELSS